MNWGTLASTHIQMANDEIKTVASFDVIIRPRPLIISGKYNCCTLTSCFSVFGVYLTFGLSYGREI